MLGGHAAVARVSLIIAEIASILALLYAILSAVASYAVSAFFFAVWCLHGPRRLLFVPYGTRRWIGPRKLAHFLTVVIRHLIPDFVTRYFRPLMLSPYTDCSTAIALRVPCRLKKRALLIAVSGQKSGDSIEGQPPATGALRSHQDAYILRDVLMKKYGYADEDIVMMLDRADIPSKLQPSKNNILRQASQLIKGAASGDRFVLFFAGHGSQSKCESGSETDGQDEQIDTSDGQHIKDNWLKRKLVDRLPAGSQLITLFDSCHSGTILDLPYRVPGRTWNIALTFVVVTRVRRAMVALRMRVRVCVRPATAGTTNGVDGRFSVTTQKDGVDASLSFTAVDAGMEAKASVTMHLDVTDVELVRQSGADAAISTGGRAPHSCSISKQARRPKIVTETHNRSGGRVISISSTADGQISLEDGRGGPLARALAQITESTPRISFGELRSALEDHFLEDYHRRVALCKETERCWDEYNKMAARYDEYSPVTRGAVDLIHERLICSGSDCLNPGELQWPQMWCSNPLGEDDLLDL